MQSLKLKSGGFAAAFIILIGACALFFSSALPGCSGGNKKSLKTPQGVVNVFVERIIKEGNLKGAFELLSAADQNTIRQSTQIFDFIMGNDNPEIAKYSDAYQQIIPDLLEMLNDLVKFHARTAKEKEGYMEVGLEISYPSDYMTVAFSVMGIFNNLRYKYDRLDIDTLSNEDRDKIIWSIKNDLRRALDSINKDKYSTYIFPVKVVDEQGLWKIDLDLARRQQNMAF